MHDKITFEIFPTAFLEAACMLSLKIVKLSSPLCSFEFVQWLINNHAQHCTCEEIHAPSYSF